MLIFLGEFPCFCFVRREERLLCFHLPVYVVCSCILCHGKRLSDSPPPFLFFLSVLNVQHTFVPVSPLLLPPSSLPPYFSQQ